MSGIPHLTTPNYLLNLISSRNEVVDKIPVKAGDCFISHPATLQKTARHSRASKSSLRRVCADKNNGISIGNTVGSLGSLALAPAQCAGIVFNSELSSMLAHQARLRGNDGFYWESKK